VSAIEVRVELLPSEVLRDYFGDEPTAEDLRKLETDGVQEYDPETAMASLKFRVPYESYGVTENSSIEIARTPGTYVHQIPNSSGHYESKQYIASEEDTEVWRKDALCREMGFGLFYSEQGVDNEPAKAICRSCVVQEECLEFALSNRERFGVWGGLGQNERAELLKRRRDLARVALSA
jgi:WhiB family redox-sensing transcriptional regulator